MTFQDSVGDNELYTAIATFALIEIGKRLPNKWVPLRAENKDDVRLAAGAVSCVVAIIRMIQSGQFTSGNAKTIIATFVQTWLVGWFLSHTAYKVVPFLNNTPAATDTEETQKVETEKV